MEERSRLFEAATATQCSGSPFVNALARQRPISRPSQGAARRHGTTLERTAGGQDREQGGTGSEPAQGGRHDQHSGASCAPHRHRQWGGCSPEQRGRDQQVERAAGPAQRRVRLGLSLWPVRHRTVRPGHREQRRRRLDQRSAPAAPPGAGFGPQPVSARLIRRGGSRCPSGGGGSRG